MKPPRSINKSFIDRLVVHINTIVKKKHTLHLHTPPTHTTIIKYVTPFKIKFIAYRNSTKYTNYK